MQILKITTVKVYKNISFIDFACKFVVSKIILVSGQFNCIRFYKVIRKSIRVGPQCSNTLRFYNIWKNILKKEIILNYNASTAKILYYKKEHCRMHCF